MLKSNIKISVIIPVYNVSKYLAKCLDSIISQSLKELEIILVNDCSPDTQDDVICLEYAKKDSRIVYLKNDVNIGLGPTRNRGIEVALGKYISFIDSDDYLLDLKAYELCYAKLEQENCDFVSFGVVGGDEDGNVDDKLWFRKAIYNKQIKGLQVSSGDKQKGFLKNNHAYGGFLSPYAVDKVYSKDFLSKHNIIFPLTTKLGEDRIFCMAVYHFASKYYIFKNNWYYYFQRVGSITKAIDENGIDSLFKMSELEYQFLQENNLWEEYKTLYVTISLRGTLRNIVSKISNFSDTMSDENKYLDYYTAKLKASFIFNEVDLFKEFISMKEVAISDKETISKALKSIFAKVFNFEFYIEKYAVVINKIVGKIYYKLITLYGTQHKLASKNIWLISERDDEAKDNGYAFFKYLREKQPQINAYYLIKYDNKNEDYLKVAKLGNVLNIGSLKSLAYYFYAKYCFSSQNELYTSISGEYSKNYYKNPLMYYMTEARKNTIFVFLQHGITKDILPKGYLTNLVKHNYFVCGANEEYKFLQTIFSECRYDKCKLIYTGFSRYDYLEDKSSDKKQILLMPTWRREFINGRSKGKENFLQSDYYKAYQNLINSPKLISLLEEKGYQLIFFPHYEINSRFYDTFSTTSKKITIAKSNSYDVPSLMMESKLMITDYSSVFWDFSYMKKPLIYYQFDKEFFRTTQYKEGYFNYERDGFGPVLETEDQVLSKLTYYFNNDFKVEDEYLDKLAKHFTYNDTHNCERIFNAITNRV